MEKNSSPAGKTVKKNRRPKTADKRKLSPVGGSSFTEIVEHVRAHARKGQHTPAIELASQTLGMADYQSAIQQMDLLDLAAKDANARMMVVKVGRTVDLNGGQR